MVDHPSEAARDAAEQAGADSESDPKFTTSSAGPDDRLSPFKGTAEDHAIGRSAAIDRFGPPVIPAAPPAPAPVVIPASQIPQGSTIIPPAPGRPGMVGE